MCYAHRQSMEQVEFDQNSGLHLEKKQPLMDVHKCPKHISFTIQRDFWRLQHHQSNLSTLCLHQVLDSFPHLFFFFHFSPIYPSFAQHRRFSSGCVSASSSLCRTPTPRSIASYIHCRATPSSLNDPITKAATFSTVLNKQNVFLGQNCQMRPF